MTRPALRALPVLAGAVVLLLPVAAPSAAAAATPAAGATPAGVCAGGDGVTVVVDFTDLGGEVEVGCAGGDAGTGREALESAGFTTTDSQPGMICAIDSLPDPCPAEFAGSYWAYFTAEEGGEWSASMEGADTADPVPGTFEGWRYNDGSEGPSVAPVADLEAGGTAGPVPADQATGGDTDESATAGASEQAAEASAAAEQQADEAEDDGSGNGSQIAGWVAIAVAIGAAIWGGAAARNRRRSRADGQE